MPPLPQAGSRTVPLPGSMMLMIVCTIEEGVKNSPLSWAFWIENFAWKYS
jgi:hypothetical protein